MNLIAGVDYLYGKGESEGENFDYHVHLDGSAAQASGDVPVQETTGLEDERGFGGLYAQVEWTPMPRLRVDLGGRFNFTDEKREGEVEGEDGEETGSSSRSVSRGSGTLGVSYLVLEGGAGGSAGDGLWVFADYRDALKPAAMNSGPRPRRSISSNRRRRRAPRAASRDACSTDASSGRRASFAWTSRTSSPR